MSASVCAHNHIPRVVLLNWLARRRLSGVRSCCARWGGDLEPILWRTCPGIWL